MKRRTALASIPAAVSLPAFAQSPTKIVFGYTAVTDFASVFVAAENDYFKKRQLDVELKFIPINSTIPAAVQAGSLQIGGPTPSVFLQSVDGGLDHVVVAGGGVDVQLEVRLKSATHRQRGIAPDRLSATSFRHQYWTIAQMLAQHTVGGCNLQPGDLLDTGTISGPKPGEAGANVELSAGGTRDVPLTGIGEQRRFLEDGDTVILRGWCEMPGVARIGFGDNWGRVLPATG